MITFGNLGISEEFLGIGRAMVDARLDDLTRVQDILTQDPRPGILNGRLTALEQVVDALARDVERLKNPPPAGPPP